MSANNEADTGPAPRPSFYCARCAQAVEEPLACGDCGSLLCRTCGTPLEFPEELAMG